MFRAVSLACSALVASTALAQTPPAPANVKILSGVYAVDSAHSQAIFTVNHFGVSLYQGQFTNPTGTLTLDVSHPEKDKVEITFPIDKVVTTVPALDTHIKSPDFFDAAKYPEAKFVSTKVEITGTTALITGDLTLKGVTKPVVLATKFVGAASMGKDPKTNIGFIATTNIRRSDWGISYIVPKLGDEVALTINVAFKAN